MSKHAHKMSNHKMAHIENAAVMPDRQAGASSKGEQAKLASVLSAFLASTYALYQKSLFYHWNVTGPHFFSLHNLFEQHYQELHNAGDVIAERLRAIGYFAPGTLAEFQQLSSIKEDKVLPENSAKMVQNLLGSHEACAQEAQRVLALAEELSDDVTVDLMVKRIAFHDKSAWMLRSLSE